MMKCELCKFEATVFCESDQASLCWTCDAKVHGANFLVARHSRTLLCSACNSHTPWKSTGAALVNAISVCNRCADQQQQQQESEESEEENDDEMDVDDEEGDNQVVPWSSCTPPPPSESSSGSDESADDGEDGSDLAATSTVKTSLKRRRQDGASDSEFQFQFQKGTDGSVSRRSYGGDWADEVVEDGGSPLLKRWLRPLKLIGSRSC